MSQNEALRLDHILFIMLISTFAPKPSNFTLLVNYYDHNFWTSALDLRPTFWHSFSFFYNVKGMFTSIFTKLPIFSLEFVQSLRKLQELSQQSDILSHIPREILNFDANTEIWSQISRESWIFDKNVKIWSQIPDENTEIWSQMPREIWNPEENTKIFSQIPRESWIFDENTGILSQIPRES